MIASLSATAKELYAYLAGSTPRLSKAQLSQIISFSRITLIVGLVFLHYEKFPNSRITPFRGMDTEAFQVATFVNSFVLFFFFSRRAAAQHDIGLALLFIHGQREQRVDVADGTALQVPLHSIGALEPVLPGGLLADLQLNQRELDSP